MKTHIYQICKAQKMGPFITNFDWEKVSEELFFELLSSKIKELTADQPEKFEETLQTAKDHLANPNALTIIDRTFKYSTKNVKVK